RRGPLGPRSERGRARLELRVHLFRRLDLGGERAGALDECGVGGAALRRLPAQLLERLARLEETPLRDREAVVGLALRHFELGDRGARFVLPAIERIALVVGLALLARELVGLLREPRHFLGRGRELRAVRGRRLL